MDPVNELNDIDARIKALINERVSPETKDTNRIQELDNEILSLVREYEAHFDHRGTKFERPTGWFGSLVSRWLPPLPAESHVIHPTKESLAGVKSYRLLSFGLLSAALTLLLLLINLIPWMRYSPMTLINHVSTSVFGERWGASVSIVIFMTILFYARPIKMRTYYRGKFWDKAAMLEEQWFRMGAENWSRGQRVYATAMFGFVHIANLIYPIASILVVGLVGAVFLAVYLNTYKATGSTKRATLAAAKLHATYNRFAVVYLLVALVITIGYVFYQPGV